MKLSFGDGWWLEVPEDAGWYITMIASPKQTTDEVRISKGDVEVTIHIPSSTKLRVE